MIHTYKMFEKELTQGNHVSYHFMYKYFDTISPKNSKLYLYERELKNTVTKYCDLNGFQNALTTPNTTLNEDACFHVGIHKRFIDANIKDFFKIKTNLPLIYFTKKVKEATKESMFKCGYTLTTLKELNHSLESSAIETLNLFKDETSQPIFASYFTKEGKIIEDEMNVEIIPKYSKENYFSIKQKILKNFQVKKEILDLYDKKFVDYHQNDFHYHVKIKLKKEGNCTVKFYRTYPFWTKNPYLNEQL